MNSRYADNTSYIGTGIYSQNKKNFSMIFYSPKIANEIGVTTVEIQDNVISHKWVWAYINEKLIEHTTCIKRKSL